MAGSASEVWFAAMMLPGTRAVSASVVTDRRPTAGTRTSAMRLSMSGLPVSAVVVLIVGDGRRCGLSPRTHLAVREADGRGCRLGSAPGIVRCGERAPTPQPATPSLDNTGPEGPQAPRS